MSKNPWYPAAALLIAALFVWFTSHAHVTSQAIAQEDEEEAAREEIQRELRQRAEEIERQLDEIEQQIRAAEQAGDEVKVDLLRSEGERLLNILEEIERRRIHEEREGENPEHREFLRELEVRRMELEVERLDHELQLVRQQSAARLAELATNKTASASYAIAQSLSVLGPEEAVDFLAEIQQSTDNEVLKRVIRHRLAELRVHVGQRERARDDLRALILE